MKSLISFWKKDWLGKLILIVAILIVLGVGINLYLFIRLTPDGLYRSLFPPTARSTFVPRNLATPTQPGAPTFGLPPTQPPVLQPTMLTQAGFVPPPTGTPTLFVAPTFTVEPPIVPANPTFTAEPSTPGLTATSSPTQALLPTGAPMGTQDTACATNGTPEKGTVVEILDGYTSRVLFEKDGRVYTVRYLGILTPPYEGIRNPFGQAAYQTNRNLAYGNPVLMYKDTTDKDDRGRFLRYVWVGDVFVNLKLVWLGWATGLPVAPDTACQAVFQSAETQARLDGVGQWLPTATPVR